MAYTQVADAIVLAVFTAYLQALTDVKRRFVQSGVRVLVIRDPKLDALLVGGGKTCDMPFWNDLADIDANVSIGAAGSPVVPLNIRLAPRDRRPAEPEPGLGLGGPGLGPGRRRSAARHRRAGGPYWVRQAQFAHIATARGVFADTTPTTPGTYTVHISGAGYVAGVTDFSAEAFIDAVHTMGDSESEAAEGDVAVRFVEDKRHMLPVAAWPFRAARVRPSLRLSTAQMDTLRLRLLKVAAHVVSSVRRLFVRLRFPLAPAFYAVSTALGAMRQAPSD